MFIRALAMASCLILLSMAVPAAAQRTDILTGEPVRPQSAHPRADPEIFNAPHAPRQTPGRPGDTPPIEIYVTPQIGGATTTPRPRYPGGVSQERRY